MLLIRHNSSKKQEEQAFIVDDYLYISIMFTHFLDTTRIGAVIIMLKKLTLQKAWLDLCRKEIYLDTEETISPDDYYCDIEKLTLENAT